MEEKVKAQTPEQPKQLSYEELRNIAGQLQQQNMQLRRALNEMNYNNTFERLKYLFKVMQVPHMFSDEFVGRCVAEIESLMTIPEDTPEDTTESKAEE